MFETIQLLSRVQIQGSEDVEAYEAEQNANRPQHLEATHPAAHSIEQAMAGGVGEDMEPVPESVSKETTETYRREEPKIGRNDPCSCGSGKKYKQCCGKLA